MAGRRNRQLPSALGLFHNGRVGEGVSEMGGVGGGRRYMISPRAQNALHRC